MIQDRFLDNVAEEIIRKHNGDLSRVIIVLPAKRARLFLRSALIGKMNGSFWMPRFFIMPEFVEYLADEVISSPLELLVNLYKCHLNLRDRPEEFVSFMKWAGLALKDFSDIDTSLADAEKLFSDLRNIREIEGWSFNSTELSKGQLDYLKFWSELSSLHKEFMLRSSEAGLNTYHTLLISVLEQFSLKQTRVEGQSIYFVGMASLSAVENKLLDLLKERNDCETLWDFDAYYVDNTMHEAGYFARKMAQHGVTGRWVHNAILTSSKNIFYHECSTSVSQAFGVAQMLQNMSVEELNDTCIVLPDLNGLDSLLSVLSDIKVPVNIAAGVPLTDTILCKWISYLFQLKVKKDPQKRGLHFQEVISWFQILIEMKQAENLSKELIKAIRSSKRIFYTKKHLKELTKIFPSLSQYIILLDDEEPVRTLQALQVALQFETPDDFVAVASSKLKVVIQQLISMTNNESFMTSWDSIHAVFGLNAGSERIYYDGQPIDGLQVLSMVETRALDFKNVFVLDANEDFLPGSHQEQSFIPLDLRRHYKLPMPEESEAMIAYSFYRLLHRTENVHLFYASISSSFKGTEMSRYLTQMEHELPSLNPKIQIHRQQLKLRGGEALGQAVANSDFVRQRLDGLFANGISPSAINKYNSCPLDFYYRYIIGLGEEDEPDEQMNSATFGTIVHYVLEKFYEKFIGSFPSVRDYDELSTNLDDKLNEAIRLNYSTQEIEGGYNLLAKSVAKSMLTEIIRYETKLLEERLENNLKPQLMKVEFPLMRIIDHESHGWNKPVVMKGKGDRLDSMAGVNYILDYKTGRVKDEDIRLASDISKLFSSGKSGKQVQLLAYIYMYAGEGISPENVKAGFYSFVNHSGGYMFLDGKKENVSQNTLTHFESAFMEWVKGIYALEFFEHNEDAAYCEYCM